MDGPLVAIQHEHPDQPRKQVPELLAQAADAVEEGGIAVMPEYFYRPTGAPLTLEAAEELAFVEEAVLEASGSTQGAIVATVPERAGEQLYNTAIVAEDGHERLRQRKLLPTPPEQAAGIAAGQTIQTASVQGLELGVLVCADVLSLDVLAEIAERSPDVVAVPVLSPLRENDTTRQARESVFLARAWDIGAYIVKAGGYREPDVVGRSLITAPWGVLAQAQHPYVSTELSVAFEIERLDEARAPFDPLRDRRRD